MTEASLSQKNRLGPLPLAALAAAGLLLRLGLAALTPGHPYDTSTFFSWADALARLGPAGFYTGGFFADYPPGYLLLLWPVGALCRALALAPFSPAANALLCLPSTLCDLGLAVTLYRLALPRAGRGGGLAAAAVVLLHPVFWFDCAVWKQVDSVFALPLVWAFLLLGRGRPLAAAAAYGAALLVKPQALLYGPVFALLFLLPVLFAPDRAGRLRAAGRCLSGAAVSLGVVLAGAAPFTGSQLPVRWLWDKYFSAVTSYPYGSVNAFNLPALFGGNWQPQECKFLFLSYRGWGLLGIAAVSGLLLFFTLAPLPASRRAAGGGAGGPLQAGAADGGPAPLVAAGPTGALLLAAFYGCGVFLFAHRMHERYLFPALALLLAAWAAGGGQQLGGLCALFSLTQLSNLAAAYFCVNSDLYLQGAGVRRLGALTALAGCAGFGWFCLLLARWAGLGPGRTAAPAQPGPSPPGRSRAKGRRKGAGSPAQGGPGRPLDLSTGPLPPRWGRRDSLAALLLTLFTAALSLPYLGSSKAPQTALLADPAAGPVVVEVEFAQPVALAEVWVFAGIGQGSVEVQGSDGALAALLPLDYTSCFCWQRQTVTLYDSRLSITVGGGAVNEIVFADSAGQPVTPLAPAGPGSALFDEQGCFPGRASQLNGSYFDEIYHARTAFEILHGLPVYETTHPPLGKEIIALGIALLGMDPLGWRVMGALFGAAMAPVFYLLARRLLRRPAAVWAAALFSLDFMRYTQSRIATIDVFVVFFILLGAFCMVWFCQTFTGGGRRGALLPAALGGLAFGLGCACKWTGLYAGLGFAAAYFLALWQRLRTLCPKGAAAGPEARQEAAADLRFALGAGVGFYLLVPLTVYALAYLPILCAGGGSFSLSALWQAQLDMFRYHSQLTQTHPFQSGWASWPWVLRPVWYYMGTGLPPGQAASIAVLGNPLVWWGSSLSILALAAWWAAGCRAKKRPAPPDGGRGTALLILLFYAAQYLPWAFVSRAAFLYHYFAALPFALLAMGFWMDRLWASRPALARPAAAASLAAAAALFCFFFPVLSGLPVPRGWAAALQWLPGWQFYAL